MTGLHIVTCVRNEADIIEAYVRHHAAFAERLWILDHNSADGTAEILHCLQMEGLPIELSHESRLGNYQAEWMTRLVRAAAETPGAKWIFPLDADEFLRPLEERWETEFEQADCVRLSSQTFVPRPEDDSAELNPVQRIQHRLVRETSSFYKVMLPAHMARRKDGLLRQGNHAFSVAGAEAPSRTTDKLCLAHYSLRTAEQHAAKTATYYFQSRIHNTPLGEPFSYSARLFPGMREDFSAFLAGFSEALPGYMPSGEMDVVRDPLDYAGVSELLKTVGIDRKNWLMRVLLAHGEEMALAAREARKARKPEIDDCAQVRLQLAEQENGFAIALPVSLGEPEPRRAFVQAADLGTGSVGLLRMRVESIPGALRIVALRFFATPESSPVTVAGRALQRLIRDVKGAFVCVHMGCVHILKSGYGAEFILQMPHGVDAIAGIEIEAGFAHAEQLGELLANPLVIQGMSANAGNGGDGELAAARERICELERLLDEARSKAYEHEYARGALAVAHESTERSVTYYREQLAKLAESGAASAKKEEAPSRRKRLFSKFVRSSNGSSREE